MNAPETLAPSHAWLADTHDVVNVATELADFDMYRQDRALVEAVHREGAGWADAALAEFGRLTGSAEVRVAGRTIDVTFGGVGALTDSRLRYRGLTKVGETMIPCELTVIGPDAWMRRPDGSTSGIARRSACSDDRRCAIAARNCRAARHTGSPASPRAR